jgi:hypothetical protein
MSFIMDRVEGQLHPNFVELIALLVEPKRASRKMTRAPPHTVHSFFPDRRIYNVISYYSYYTLSESS